VAERALRADAQRNREKVLRAAQDAFAVSGYGVPLDEIAAIAGVGPGTVYRHFPTKEALFEAVVGARLEDLVKDARGRAEANDPDAAFFGFLARVAAEATAKRDLPDAITISGSLRTDLYEALDVLLHRAQQAGAVRAEITPSDITVLMRTLFLSIRDSSVADPDPARYGRLVAVIINGLRPPAN
jgi:AcrR family transcriptional regulator